jgi:hypothetical protein
MLEVELDVVTSNVGGHGNDRSAIKLADKMASRDAVQVGHNNIHQNKIVLRAALDFVDSFQTIELSN